MALHIHVDLVGVKMHCHVDLRDLINLINIHLLCRWHRLIKSSVASEQQMAQ